MREFNRLGASVLEAMQALERGSADAERALRDAVVAEGREALRSAALASGGEIPLGLRTRSVAGVPIFEIEHEAVVRPREGRGFSLAGTTARTDDVADRFEGLLEGLLDLAALELSLRRLADEITRTTRRARGGGARPASAGADEGRATAERGVTSGNGNGTGALEAVQQLEASLDARTAAARAADGRVASAGAEADALLAFARASGDREAERRRAAIVAAAHEEAAATRGAAAEAVEALLADFQTIRDRLADELCEVVLSGEGA